MPVTRTVAMWIGAALLATVVATRPLTAQQANYQYLQTFSAALNQIRTTYVDTVGYPQLVEAAIRGALRSLDPHNYLVSRRDAEFLASLASGDSGDVGVRLEEVDGAATVLSVVPRGPADRKGIAPGDRLAAVDDTIITGVDVRTVERRLIGRRGAKVRLTFERGSRLQPQVFRVTLERDRVEYPSVRAAWRLDDSTAYLWLAEFGDGAAEQVERALRDLTGRGARRAVLDLRGNPGGRVSASVQVASLFLPRGTIVFRTRGRNRDVHEDFTTERDGRFRDLPLVVLIDERSASASEALAGSLQDHDRALLVGRRTFGKALMQAPVQLPGGDVMWLTVGRVYTPSGRFIQRPYAGLARAQYVSFAGQEGDAGDSSGMFTTDAGRLVRGGGGIAPDVELPPDPRPPTWYAPAADSAFPEAIADSVAHTLGAGPRDLDAWVAAPDRWAAALLEPFLARVRARLGREVTLDSAAAAAVTELLVERVVEVRWGEAGLERLRIRHDPGIAAALRAFPVLSERLTGSR